MQDAVGSVPVQFQLVMFGATGGQDKFFPGVGSEDVSMQRCTQVGVNNNPVRVAAFFPRQPGGEPGIVLQQGADADQDGVRFIAQPVNVAAGLFTGYPVRVAGMGGDPAVHAGGNLQSDKRSAGGDVFDVGFIQAAAFVFQDAGNGFNAGGPQAGYAAACHLRVGVFHADDHPIDAGGNDGFGAGWGPALVIAGLQGDVHGCLPGHFPGFPQGINFGVGLAGGRMKPLADNGIVFNHQGPDHGIGRCSSPASGCQFQGLLQIFFIG